MVEYKTFCFAYEEIHINSMPPLHAYEFSHVALYMKYGFCWSKLVGSLFYKVLFVTSSYIILSEVDVRYDESCARVCNNVNVSIREYERPTRTYPIHFTDRLPITWMNIISKYTAEMEINQAEENCRQCEISFRVGPPKLITAMNDTKTSNRSDIYWNDWQQNG